MRHKRQIIEYAITETLDGKRLGFREIYRAVRWKWGYYAVNDKGVELSDRVVYWRLRDMEDRGLVCWIPSFEAYTLVSVRPQ